MKVRSIRIKNFRLLRDTTLELDDKTTVIVGRNNTGKTSCMTLARQMFENKTSSYTYNDCPIADRSRALQLFIDFLLGEKTADDCYKEWPTTSLTFLIDYSTEAAKDDLGALSPFIIDLDDDITCAVIKIEYRLIISDSTKELFAESIEKLRQNRQAPEAIESVRKMFIENFSQFFTLKILALHPQHENISKEQPLAVLKDLIVLYSIPAERSLDENGSGQSSLNAVIEEYFKKDVTTTDHEMLENMHELQTRVESVGQQLQKDTTKILDDLIAKTVGFGYPNEYEMQIGVTTDLSLSQQFISNSQLNYWDKQTLDRLPSDYNGLGYKNLIKIQFLLAQFTRDFAKKGTACLALLFVEEPESHMHPQMQQRFVDYLEEYLHRLAGGNNIQSIITTHASHIANEVRFDKIRYAKRHQNNVEFKDLKTFATTESSNVEFVHKYLTLTKCDLFFADKAILVEGASERILLPDMIDKCSKNHEFDDGQDLSRQYYSIIEVGGAYAHRFIPFMQFIEIPCLIITDIDPLMPVEKNGKTTYISCNVSSGTRSSNATINQWLKKKRDLPEDSPSVAFNDIKNLPDDDKTDEQLHIEFQTTEQGLCGKSLEESIRNVNRDYYGISDPTEENIGFKDNGKGKTGFALDLVMTNSNYVIPQYIKTGLVWLSKQPIVF